ncbi:MAG: hypothetical protein R3C02_09300 [Planctomycetaceae bacterium]
MTIAVCMKCGHQKVGAFALCPVCSFAPQQSDEFAKSILLSDQAATAAELEIAMEKLKSGSSIEFDPEEIHMWSTEILERPNQLKMPIGCAIAWYLPLILACVLVLVFAITIAYLRFVSVPE